MSSKPKMCKNCRKQFAIYTDIVGGTKPVVCHDCASHSQIWSHNKVWYQLPKEVEKVRGLNPKDFIAKYEVHNSVTGSIADLLDSLEEQNELND